MAVTEMAVYSVVANQIFGKNKPAKLMIRTNKHEIHAKKIKRTTA